MSHTPLGQSDLVYQYKISYLSILVFVENCGNQALSPIINQGDHSRPNIAVAGQSVRLRTRLMVRLRLMVRERWNGMRLKVLRCEYSDS